MNATFEVHRPKGSYEKELKSQIALAKYLYANFMGILNTKHKAMLQL